MSDEDFTAYVRANYDRLLRFVRGLVQQHAEDVVQTTILNLWAMRDTIDPTRVDALVFTSLRRSAINHWRNEGRQPEPGKGIRSEIDNHTPDQSIDAREAAQTLHSRLVQARSTLSARERRVLAVWLVWHPGRDEAGALLGVTKSAYSAVVHTALNKLTRNLGPHQDVLLQTLADLGAGAGFDVLAEVFQADLPEKK